MIRAVIGELSSVSSGQARGWDLSDRPTADGELIWLDVERPTPEDIQFLAENFAFHPLALEDVGRPQRAKIDRYPNLVFLVLFDLDLPANGGPIDEHQLNIFLGSRYLVTVHDEPIAEIEEVARRWRENAVRIERNINVLLYSLLDTIVDHYFPVIDAIGDRVEALEESVFTAAGQATLRQVFALKKELIAVRRAIAPERDVLALLAKGGLRPGEAGDAWSDPVAAYFQDVYDHVLRVIESIDTYRDVLSGVLDAYLSWSSNNLAVASNQLSQVMKVMTSFSIILMSVTLVASVYGMNFDVMPELRWRYGYPAVLLAMAAIGLGLTIYFRRKRWL